LLIKQQHSNKDYHVTYNSAFNQQQLTQLIKRKKDINNDTFDILTSNIQMMLKFQL